MLTFFAKQKLKFLVPSLFTTCAMFFSFYALMLTVSRDFSDAAYAVIVAMVFDSLDGRAARMTNTSTKFGASYDSITDMMAYGVAPSIMIYNWGLLDLGKVGYLVGFIFCACVGLRLARFNVMLEVVDKKYFQGLSSTLAGGVVVSYILMCEQYNLHSRLSLVGGIIVTLSCAFLMVSSIRFCSFKELKLSRGGKLAWLAFILSGSLAIYYFKGLAIFSILSAYVILTLLIELYYLALRTRWLKNVAA